MLRAVGAGADGHAGARRDLLPAHFDGVVGDIPHRHEAVAGDVDGFGVVGGLAVDGQRRHGPFSGAGVRVIRRVLDGGFLEPEGPAGAQQELQVIQRGLGGVVRFHDLLFGPGGGRGSRCGKGRAAGEDAERQRQRGGKDADMWLLFHGDPPKAADVQVLFPLA